MNCVFLYVPCELSAGYLNNLFLLCFSQERRRVPETVTAEIDPEKLKAAAIKSLNGKNQGGIKFFFFCGINKFIRNHLKFLTGPCKICVHRSGGGGGGGVGMEDVL